MWYRFLQFWSQWLFLAFFGIRVYGQRNVPGTGPVILASTHQSFLDPVLVGLGLPRPVHILARDSLFRNRLFRRLIRSLNAFPVKRNAADYSAMHESLERLEEGKQLLLFPEGTRTRDGSIGKLHPGLALLARRTDAWVVPVTIDGAHECWPRGRKLFRPGKIRVLFGPPMRVDDDGRAAYRRFAKMLHERLVQQQRTLRRIAALEGREARETS